jgi:uncharacterized protein (TIGR00730 family)
VVKRVIAVFGGSQTQPGEPDYDAAVEAGSLLAEAGFTVATGGYAGVMEAAAAGAAMAGGDTIGFTAPPVFPGRSGANSHIRLEVPSESLSLRIHNMVEAASGFLVMPGSIGTLTELMVVWNSAFVTRYSGHATKPVATVGEPWRSLVPQLAQALDTDQSLVSCHDDAAAAVHELASQL